MSVGNDRSIERERRCNKGSTSTYIVHRLRGYDDQVM
jgi:hypothetical protein